MSQKIVNDIFKSDLSFFSTKIMVLSNSSSLINCLICGPTKIPSFSFPSLEKGREGGGVNSMKKGTFLRIFFGDTDSFS